jgi:hypothetical protein
MDSISRVRICGTRLAMPRECLGFGSRRKSAMLEMVGRTLRMTSSLSLIWGVTVITSPTETDWGVVVTVVRAPALVVWVVSALTLK